MVFDGLSGQTCGMRVKLEDLGCHGLRESGGGDVRRGLRLSTDGLLTEQTRSWLDHIVQNKDRYGNCGKGSLAL